MEQYLEELVCIRRYFIIFRVITLNEQLHLQFCKSTLE